MLVKLYSVYYGIKTRCNDKDHRDYQLYGARGIKNEFLTYEDFEEWSLKNGYKEGLQIDRIDTNGPYSPDNCRWVSGKVNSNNRRDNIAIEYNGETKTLTEWCELAGADRQAAYRKISRYQWPPELVVKTIMEEKNGTT